MEAIITFAIGRLLYSFIERHTLRYIILELVFTTLFVAISTFFNSFASVSVRAVLIGSSFMLTSLASLVLNPVQPIEAGGQKVTMQDTVTAIGIIDFVWFAIMAASLTITNYGLSTPPFSLVDISPNLRVEYYEKLYDQLDFFLSNTINAIPILGTVLAACMAILWAGEFWRKDNDHESQLKYRNLTVAACKMSIAFFVCIFSFCYWLGLPLIENMNSVLDRLK
ncbi:hypothetical protein HUU42_03365 [bacterium]|nr:hypothetical protein [bacterium]